MLKQSILMADTLRNEDALSLAFDSRLSFGVTGSSLESILIIEASVCAGGKMA